MKYLLPLLLLCACKTTSSSEAQVHATTAETLDTGGRTETHTEEAPGKTTTTVEEFGLPGEQHGGAQDSRESDHADLQATDEAAHIDSENQGQRVQGEHDRVVSAHAPILLKRTVTVTEQGRVDTTIVADLKSQQREDTVLTGSAQNRSTFDFMHSPLMWIGAAVLIAIVLGTALYVVVKVRKAVPV